MLLLIANTTLPFELETTDVIAVPLTAGNCVYPVNIETQFPYWTTIKNSTSDINLIDLIKEYYNWLNCGSTTITPYFGFFELDKLKDINSQSQSFTLNSFIETFIPSLDKSTVGQDVSEQEVKTLLNSIKTKLYGKKGTEASFKYIIALVFGVAQNDIYITHPKKYLMVLNGGANSQIAGIDRSLRGILNFSILKDNTIWNDYTYIINVSGINAPSEAERYQKVIRPLLHPAGLNGLYQERKDLFNPKNEDFGSLEYEIPLVKYYLEYTFNTNSTITNCTWGWPQHVFPDWDKDIYVYDSQLPAPGVTFGGINIRDFLRLEPLPGGTFPNEALTC